MCSTLLRRLNSFVRLQGPDQLGMTAKFTDMLAKEGLNIERLETTVSLSAAAQPMFNIVCDATAAPSVDLESLEKRRTEMEVALGAEIKMGGALGGGSGPVK